MELTPDIEKKFADTRLRLQRELNVQLILLPNNTTLRRRIREYISKKQAERKMPRIEEIRKSFSPTCGRTIQHLRNIVIDMGYKIRNDDRVALK